MINWDDNKMFNDIYGLKMKELRNVFQWLTLTQSLSFNIYPAKPECD